MGVTASLIHNLLDLLVPAACLACDNEVRGGRLFLGLCPACSCRLRRLSAACCGSCGRPVVSVMSAAQPPAFDRLHAVWNYADPFDAVIRAFKFRRLEYLGAQIAEELCHRLPRLSQLAEAQLVVPVPLHWLRHLRRGYNQAERIARPLAHRMRLPLVQALRRRRNTRPQTSLDRTQRSSNLRGAFRVRREKAVAGRTVLLIDDVVTTGATLDAAARALKQAGAERVLAVAAGIRI